MSDKTIAQKLMIKGRPISSLPKRAAWLQVRTRCAAEKCDCGEGADSAG